VASCRRTPEGSFEAHVRPVKLPAYHPLAQPRNEENRVLIQPAYGPPTVVDGKGAGRWPTSESVLADILDIYRFRRAHPAHHAMASAEAAGPAWEPGVPIGGAPAARRALSV
jgi:Homoserine dehydrogenase